MLQLLLVQMLGRGAWCLHQHSRGCSCQLSCNSGVIMQVTGLPTKYHTALAWAGRIGWVGKAVVYAMIGGLACQFAVSGYTPNPDLPQTAQVSASPQVCLPRAASQAVPPHAWQARNWARSIMCPRAVCKVCRPNTDILR